MKAEEKAKELFERFEFQVRNADGDISHTKEESKQCALISVEEIIQSYPTTVETFNNYKGLNVVHVDNRKYWQEVKQKIEKL